MISSVLQKLLAGEYICQIAHRPEYEALQEAGVSAEVDAWLGRLDMRLARLRDNGAFFMAPNLVTPATVGRVRDELGRFRDVYGPIVLMLNLIRQAKSEGLTFSAGEYVQLAELETSVSESTSLETQLRALYGVIRDSKREDTNRTYLKKLLEHLRKDGFVVLANAQTEVYQFTGKIDQVHVVLEFISEYEPIMSSDVDHQVEAGQTLDLMDSSGADND